jgi:hypothetical protein
MSRKNFLQFRPSFESLDVRAMPSPLLMQACASGVHEKEIDRTTVILVNPGTVEAARGTQVADGDGNVWACYYTENSCECDPL